MSHFVPSAHCCSWIQCYYFWWYGETIATSLFIEQHTGLIHIWMAIAIHVCRIARLHTNNNDNHNNNNRSADFVYLRAIACSGMHMNKQEVACKNVIYSDLYWIIYSNLITGARYSNFLIGGGIIHKIYTILGVHRCIYSMHIIPFNGDFLPQFPIEAV